MYRIKKIFNNNVLLAEDHNGTEHVFMGRGIGYFTSSGDHVNEDKIEKTFQLDISNRWKSRNASEFAQTDKYFETIKEIVDSAHQLLKTTLSDYIYFSLTDHIDFAIERSEKGIYFRSPIQWEIKKAYPIQYQIGLNALEIIKRNLNIRLPKEEATSIAMHIINASGEEPSFEMLYEELALIQDVLRVIKLHFMIDLDEETTNYERFIVHLKFFIHRLRKNEQLDSKNLSFFKTAIQEWPTVYDCVARIVELVYQSKNTLINQEEMFYLMIHINRLVDRDQDD